MLDFLRKRKRNWVIIFFVGIIILVFALFYGGSGSLRDQGRGDVAEVNGEIISQREFALHYQRQLDRYREMFQGALTPEMIKGLNLKSNLVDELIQKKLVLQEARRLGLTATDAEVANHLARVPEFQVAGRFNKEQYLQVLRTNRLLPAQFEEEQREQLTMERLYSLILDSIHVTDAEVRERYRLDQERINLSYIRLPVADFFTEVKLAEDDIKSFYDRNRESLREPLKLQVEYLSYPYEGFGASIQIGDKEIEEFYQAHLDTKFRQPREAKVRYISVRIPPNADTKEKLTIWGRLEGIAKEARAGKNFAELAKKASDDPAEAQEGDAGWILQGQMPPTIDKIIFSLPKGGVSDPVETPGGFQIYKIEDIKAEKSPSLKEARPEIIRELRREKAKADAAKAAERDRANALSGTDFAQIAKESGAAIKTTDWFAQGEVLPDIGPNQEFYRHAFTLGPKETSPVVEGDNAYYLLRLKQRREPVIPPLENVRDQIEKGLKESRAYEMALQKATALLDQLRKDKDIAKVAAANGLKVEETGFFPRSTPQLPKIGELAELRFERLALSAKQPFADRVFTQKDGAYVLAFKSSQPADMAQFEREKELHKQQVLAESRQRALIKFLEGLQAKAKITVNQAFLEEI